MFPLSRSKTDQTGKGQVISLGCCSVGDLCPVRAILDYVKIHGTSAGELFCQSNLAPLARYQFWTITSHGLQEVGIVGSKFGTHSFHIGAASTAATLGYGDEQIMKVRRWSSYRYKTYVCSLPQ